MQETVRLRGKARVVAEGRTPFRRTTLVEGDKTLGTVDLGEFDLDMVDGGTVAVEAPKERLRLFGAPAKVLRGAWSELRDMPEASGLARNEVAPFSSVELHVVTIEDGDRIEVYGTVFEEAFDEATGTLRTAAVKRPSRMLAEMIAFDDANEMRAMTLAIADLKSTAKRETETKPAQPDKDARSKDPTRPVPAAWIPVGIGAAIIAAHVVWIANARATEAWSIELMAVCWAVVAFVFRPTREVPDFFNRDKSTKEESAVKYMMGVLLFATPEMMLGWYSESTSPSPTTFLIVTFAFLIGWFFIILWWRSHTYSLYARMIGTPRVAISEASGKSGTCSGVVSDSTPVQVAGRQAAIGVVTEFKTRRGNETSAKFFGNGTFVIDTSEGPISVDPSECMWASSEEERQEAMVFRHSVSRWIPVGGKIAACGRYVNYTKKGAPPLRLVSEGANPVILFATNDIDPLRLATRIVSQRRITLLGILAVTLALAAVVVRSA